MLEDGQFHSGVNLAETLGISRAAIWKIIKRLAERGVEIESVKGRGYRWTSPGQLLDSDTIQSLLAESTGKRIGEIEVLTSVDSTNSRLMSRPRTADNRPTVCIAEQQLAGRGRRGREWISPPGGNLYLSLSWQFDLAPVALSGLSLAAGVAVVKALERLGVSGTGIKWPNDIYHDGRKLGGLLIELDAEADGPSRVVTGIGLNVALRATPKIGQPYTDLRSIEGNSIAVNQLAAAVLDSLFEVYTAFAEQGLACVTKEYQRLDSFAGKQVELHLPDRIERGIACGIDAHGALKMRTNGVEKTYMAGELSLRPAQ